MPVFSGNYLNSCQAVDVHRGALPGVLAWHKLTLSFSKLTEASQAKEKEVGGEGEEGGREKRGGMGRDQGEMADPGPEPRRAGMRFTNARLERGGGARNTPAS